MQKLQKITAKPEDQGLPLIVNEPWVEIHLDCLYHECNRRNAVYKILKH